MTFTLFRRKWDRVPEPIDESDDDDEEAGGSDGGLDWAAPTGTGGEVAQQFSSVIADMIVTGYEEGHPADNVLMEIKGFKFSRNKVTKCIS